MNIKCAGVVLYNPDLERLHENLRSIRDQVDLIIFVDNSSLNIKSVEEMIKSEAKVELIKNDSNLGIAAALNQIAQHALQMGYDWVYLLDQDSISSPTIIATYENYISFDNVALLSPYIIDINKSNFAKYKSLKMPEYSKAKWAITSGSLIRLDIWEEEKFDESLFIDAVDTDYCIRLNTRNFAILRINSEYLLQEVGNAEPTFFHRLHRDNTGKWSWVRHYRSNHSLMRHYYMVRNNIILLRRYNKNFINFSKGAIFIGLFISAKLVFEKNRFELGKMFLKGIRDGISYRI